MVNTCWSLSLNKFGWNFIADVRNKVRGNSGSLNFVIFFLPFALSSCTFRCFGISHVVGFSPTLCSVKHAATAKMAEPIGMPYMARFVFAKGTMSR